MSKYSKKVKSILVIAAVFIFLAAFSFVTATLSKSSNTNPKPKQKIEKTTPEKVESVSVEDKGKEKEEFDHSTYQVQTNNTTETSVQTKITQQVSSRVGVNPKVKSETKKTQAQPTVTLQIVSPNGTSDIKTELKKGDDVCDILLRVEAEEKLSSVTVDDSYFSVYNSLYVTEINGFRNNWVFEVNGESPLGCSLYKPKEGDKIIWKYL